MTPRDVGRRPGVYLAEAVIALAVLAAAAGGVAQLLAAARAEAVRTTARAEAAEVAANVLEAVRAVPWDDLTAEWAAAQKLPAFVGPLLPAGRLTVKVGPEPDRPAVKRVTVQVGWTEPGGQPARPVVLVGLFALRTGGKSP